ncbi:MAG: InlB B-repeat-containing protein [Clostridia bacterium]|nr:InlB B-repeat-containing protein [Clostridia bacterium]
MKQRMISILLVLLMILGAMPMGSLAQGEEGNSVLITSITVALPQAQPTAGSAPYYPELVAVNEDTALTDRITFYAEWYESTDDVRHSPDQYTELSTEAFVLDMYYNLYVGITAKYGNEIASDCQLIAILPDGSTVESLMFDYDPEYLFAGFDFLFDKAGLPVTTISVNGYGVDAPVKDVVVEDDRADITVAPADLYEFYVDVDGEVGTHINKNGSAVFEKDKAYWLYIAVATDAGYNLGEMTAENFAVEGGCEDLYIRTYVEKDNLLYLLIRLNRFEKPAQTNILADGYTLGRCGYDVTAAVESDVFDLIVGNALPYALFYPDEDAVGVVVGEDFINPDVPYWLGVFVTNDTGDFSAYTKYDFTLDIPFTNYYIEKNVEYVGIYFQLEPLAYQSVERLDFELDGYYGGASLDDVTLGLEQGGFRPYSEYNDHFGFHYDGLDEPGTYITPSEAATLVFDNSEVLWLWVNVLPLYHTAFTPPPEVSLNVDYTECLMKGCVDGSLDIAFKLAPLQNPNDLTITVSGYENEGDILEFEAAVSGKGAETYPGGYFDSYGIHSDNNNEPGAFLTQGSFKDETSYWAYIALLPENGYDLSALKAEDFAFDGFTPENAMGAYDAARGIYYLYFKLPQIQFDPVNEMITFSLDGYELGGEINQIQISHNGQQIDMDQKYGMGYVILPEIDGKPDDNNFYQEGTFAADTVYWLGIAITPAEGYSLSKVRGEQFLLEVFDYSQVFVDVVSSTEAYVYFKLPPAKEAHDVIFTLGGEDGMIFGYSVPDGTCITKPAEPGQEGKLFLGWYTEEGEKWDFATPVTKDLLLTAKFEDVTPTVLYGDVDGDTKVTAADALEVLKSVVGKVTLTEAQFTAADTDGNGKADATDALNILKKVVGKIDKFPVEE